MKQLYELLVGIRYVRPKTRSGFVSFISAISMLGIAIGVAVLIVVLSVMNGFEGELRERILALASHATITGFDDKLPQWRAVQAHALEHESVTAVAPFIEGEGMLVNGELLSGVLVRGMDPVAERNVSTLGGLMQQGSPDDLVAGEYRVLIGAALAEVLGVAVGDKVLLLISRANVTPAGIMPRMRRFTVTGIFSAGMHEFDRGLAFVHLEDAAKLYRLGDAVSGVRLRLADMYQAPQVVTQVAREIGGGVFVSDWTRKHANFFRSIQLTKTVMFIILLLVVGVAAFNIVSTLVMVVKDKRSDIAILRTLGASPGSIMSVFMVQGTLIGAIGTLLGVVLGILGALNIEAIVRWLESLLHTELVSPEVYFLSDLPARIEATDVTQIALTAFLLALLSTIYPAWRAARTRPAEALRHE
ncbi:MAG: lipoprotein-releasing ABC transporter permease subunit [Gammaproteobacteria bacterium]|nr:lipoprotein-releasing ABC transporter permease subunit [Gammaproteobacteria bacterium]NNF59778.1 lipoprotein-releasing ABC transporter permease subunit [Gammaproteobacteria bacterium]NNM20972.1 lipoprotein-releasing ABC transporter permease subunit [Gammaproteobacteria bacterium]